AAEVPAAPAQAPSPAPASTQSTPDVTAPAPLTQAKAAAKERPRAPVAPERTQASDLAASARTGSVLVTASGIPSEILENGRLLGPTPARLSLTPGQHTLTARPVGGGKEQPFVVTVTPGGFGVVGVALRPAQAEEAR